ncbi:hypothetical protein GH714_032973 [Hevea brasiliensis]|uniref:Uncharacterized protein n=1 Tax=Hevea brasiliensis TaxID=3981 RepID=A0A6A6L727_HEVBR|nr:hypothetical protein GH714_032973 [Hevea brasiliensis]
MKPLGRLGAEDFASISSLTGQQTSSVGVNPQPLPPPSSQFGSPLFGLELVLDCLHFFHGCITSIFFDQIAGGYKFKGECDYRARYRCLLIKYAMQQAFKTMMNQTNTQNNQFTNPAFFHLQYLLRQDLVAHLHINTITSGAASSPSYSTHQDPWVLPSPPPVASQSAVTVDVPVEAIKVTDAKDETKIKKETKKYGKIDLCLPVP